MLAKAKTGTGKTLSFLLPAIEGVARTPRAQRRGISVLIISPTRELAQQIADEAKQVLVRVWVGFRGQTYYCCTVAAECREREGGGREACKAFS